VSENEIPDDRERTDRFRQNYRRHQVELSNHANLVAARAFKKNFLSAD
jgi:hypothetical protein